MDAIDIAMGYAYSKLGDRYVFGAKGPDEFDCSGLTADAYAAAGIFIGAGTIAQVHAGSNVGRGVTFPELSWQLLRGDLVLPTPDHVQLYDGAGWIVEAPHTGGVVQRVRQWATDPIYAARRIVPAARGAALLWPGTVLSVGTQWWGTGKWQARMNVILRANLHVSGIYDPATAMVTKRFQVLSHLPVTGNVDGDTWLAAFPS